MSALSDYVSQLGTAIENCDGELLCQMLRQRTESFSNAMVEYYQTGATISLPVDDTDWDPLAVVVDKCFSTVLAIRHNEWVDAYEHITAALASYIDIVSSQDAWTVPLLHQLCEDLRIIARAADLQMEENHRKGTKLESAEPILKRAFTVVNNDRRDIGDNSRRIGVLGIMNQLLRVYFTINNLGLCNNVIKTTTQPNFPQFEEFPLPHRITYKFYEGRYKFYEDKFAEAVTSLQYALARTLPKSMENRRRILLYLIPAQILTGRLPSRRTLDCFNMIWYQDIVEAIRTGNIGQFDAALTRYGEFFIQSALYLAVERMKPFVYRALVRKVATITDQNKIALVDIVKAWKVCGIEADLDSVECVLASLICKGYLKGYISHKIGYLVLSKKSPFPPVQELCEVK